MYKRKFKDSKMGLTKKLAEMPHVDYGNDEIFDLEIETFKDISQFIQYLNDIIDGKPKKDKYGNIINLKSRKEKIEFIQSLKENPMFTAFVKHRLSDNEQHLLNMIMRI